MEYWNKINRQVSPGEKIQIEVEPNVSGYKTPVTIVCGKLPGKTVLITAGIHSGEYPGVPAVIQIAHEIDPAQVKGRIIMFHCVNTSGFWAKSRDCIPEDGFNLNSHYPGKPDGTVGARIADFFVKEIFPEIDFVIDLHSGGQMEPLTPCLFFPVGVGDHVRKEALAAAMATDIPYLIASSAKTGQYSYAAGLGIPGLLLERGYCGYCRQDWIAAYKRDVRLLLDYLGLYPICGDTNVCAKKTYLKTNYVTTDVDGLWYPAITENKVVNKGDLLGTIEDLFGNHKKNYVAQADGTVFYYTSGLAVVAGDPLVAYGLEESVVDN